MSSGSVPYDEQQEAIRSGWVSANWDYFQYESHYFSDRLPISLAAGVPHVTSDHDGYDDLFTGVRGLYRESSPAAIVQRVEQLLARGPEACIADGKATQRFANENMTQALSARAVLVRTVKALD